MAEKPGLIDHPISEYRKVINPSLWTTRKYLPEDYTSNPKGVATESDKDFTLTAIHTTDDVVRMSRMFFPEGNPLQGKNSESVTIDDVGAFINSNPGSRFVINQTFLSQAKTAAKIEQAASEALNGDLKDSWTSFKKALIEPGLVDNPLVTIGRTFLQVPLTPLGLRLDWNSNKYLKEDSGTEDGVGYEAKKPINEVRRVKSSKLTSETSLRSERQYPDRRSQAIEANLNIEAEWKDPDIDAKYITDRDLIPGDQTSNNVYKNTSGSYASIRLGRRNGAQSGLIESIGRATDTLDNFEDYVPKEDLIPFYFSTITPNTVEHIQFRALLESFDDSYTADIQGNRYVGRAEEFYVYQGFKRTISLAFKISAFSQKELQPIYEKLNRLAASTAPSYGDNTFMRGTLTSVTVGDYLKRLKGYVTAVRMSWDKEHPWEVADKIQKLPHILTVNLDFTPIHDFVVENSQNYFAS